MLFAARLTDEEGLILAEFFESSSGGSSGDADISSSATGAIPQRRVISVDSHGE